MLLFGRRQLNPTLSVDVAAAYTPTTRTWRRLVPLRGPSGNFQGHYSAVWTGREMMVLGPFDSQAFNPRTGHWRRLAPERGGGAGGLVVWTGDELIDWGGGCCGDASSAGGAYDPTTNRWRKLARSPLAPSQQPLGAWTGRELIIMVSGMRPTTTTPFPASFARAAAYDPTSDKWRRIASPPEIRQGATVVWDGREVLVVGGAAVARGGKPPPLARTGFAYNPATNRWRKLPPMDSGRMNFAAVWTGRHLFVWGGREDAGAGEPLIPSHGLVFDPRANGWSPLARAPLVGRLDPTAVWTGRSMIVWGGSRPKEPIGTGTRPFVDGAIFTPATPVVHPAATVP